PLAARRGNHRACPPGPLRRRCLRLPGWPGPAPHPSARPRDKEFANYFPWFIFNQCPSTPNQPEIPPLFLSNAPGRWLVDDGPKDTQFFNGVDKLVEIHRLHHVGVHAQFVAGNHIAFLARRREHHHRDHFQFLVGFDRLENFETVDLWQLEVEQKDGRALATASLELSPVIEVVEGLLAVRDHHHLIAEVVFFQGSHGEFDILRVVFHQQYASNRFHVLGLLPLWQRKVKRGPGTNLPLGLPAAFQQVAEEAPHNHYATFKTRVEGRVRRLPAQVREETYCIGREAIINALSHSEGLRVEAVITYESWQFRLRVRDNGRGFDPKILGDGGRPDHWGLKGMRERADRMGA